MINEAYSRKDLPNQSFTHLDASEFSNTEIVGSCFYWEAPEDYVGNPHGLALFPPGTTGLTCRGCNLDNRIIPPGTILIGGTHEMIRVQKDLEDWIVNASGSPTKPKDEARFIRWGVSTDPADIPATRQSKSPVRIAEEAGVE